MTTRQRTRGLKNLSNPWKTRFGLGTFVDEILVDKLLGFIGTGDRVVKAELMLPLSPGIVTTFSFRLIYT